jgi:Ferrochelatase
MQQRCSIKARMYPRSSQIEAFARQNHKKKQTIQKFHPIHKIVPLFGNNRGSFERHSSASEAVLTSKSEPNSLIIGNEKVGVLLLNLGGPETLDDVQPFLFNLFADPVNCYIFFSLAPIFVN